MSEITLKNIIIEETINTLKLFPHFFSVLQVDQVKEILNKTIN